MISKAAFVILPMVRPPSLPQAFFSRVERSSVPKGVVWTAGVPAARQGVEEYKFCLLLDQAGTWLLNPEPLGTWSQ